MVKIRKSVSSNNDGLKQLEISQFFASSSSSKPTITKSKVRLGKVQKCSKQLFTESITVIHDSDSDAELNNPEHKELTSDIPQENHHRIFIEHRSLPIPLDDSDCEKDIILDFSYKNNINTTPKKKTVAMSINKPDGKLKTPEKLKPRILQAKLSNDETESSTSISDKTDITNCSQGSSDSNDTIVYDVENAPNENSIIIYVSPSSRLISKINKNIESTKVSSIAYRRSLFTSPQKNSEPTTPTKNRRSHTPDMGFQTPEKRPPPASPRKSPRSPRKKLQYDEIVTPRAVNLVTRIIKYVFMQPHLKILFDEEEVFIFHKFYDMPQPEYQYLCYKLFTRLPKWYNIFRLCENIRLEMNHGDVFEMHKCLGENGFVLTGMFVINSV